MLISSIPIIISLQELKPEAIPVSIPGRNHNIFQTIFQGGATYFTTENAAEQTPLWLNWFQNSVYISDVNS